MERGYFALHRKVFDSDIWQHPTARIVWIYILGSVTHKDTTLSARYSCIPAKAGQMVAGRRQLAERCALTEKQIRSALNYLKSTNRITIEATNRFSIITVVNWHTYRAHQLAEGQQKTESEGQQRASRGPHSRSKRS